VSSERIYFSKEEQIFLMEMFETEDLEFAAERFALLMVEERADPTQIQKYLLKIIKKWMQK
jgi:hypothetical protein